MSAVDADVLDRVRMRLAERNLDAGPAQVAEALRSGGGLVGDVAVLDVVDALRRDSVGAGVLEPLLHLEGVTDVLVNGPREVYVDVGRGLQRSELSFPDDDAVRRLAQRLAAAAGRRLDDASPYVDVRLRDGTRFHAVLAPIAAPGTCLSLRVPARSMLTLADLVTNGALTGDGAALLHDIVQARLPFVVTGGTGTGKPTLLNALLSTVPHQERLVVVEDASELRPRHPHVVSLEARPPNVEGAGSIAMRDLVRQALRMRPDRLVVGEVRGAEVVDLLAAMNTGHEGGCTTVHANTAADVPARFEALGVAAGLSRPALHAQLGSALDVVLHVHRDREARRRLTEIAVLVRDRDGLVEASPAVRFPVGAQAVTGPGASLLDRWLAGAES